MNKEHTTDSFSWNQSYLFLPGKRQRDLSVFLQRASYNWWFALGKQQRNNFPCEHHRPALEHLTGSANCHYVTGSNHQAILFCCFLGSWGVGGFGSSLKNTGNLNANFCKELSHIGSHTLLLNYDYEILILILANRLKQLIAKYNQPDQTRFIPNSQRAINICNILTNLSVLNCYLCLPANCYLCSLPALSLVWGVGGIQIMKTN